MNKLSASVPAFGKKLGFARPQSSPEEQLPLFVGEYRAPHLPQTVSGNYPLWLQLLFCFLSMLSRMSDALYLFPGVPHFS